MQIRRPIVLVLVASIVPTAGLADDVAELPIRGDAVPSLSAYDDFMRDALSRSKTPGGALAVAKDGRLVFARGYGWADVAAKQPVQPDALFRIASISKPITAVAVLRLVEQGKLALDEKALDIVRDIEPPTGATVDPRWRTITVRQLLQHTAGWDRDRSFDPMFRPVEVARSLGEPSPAGATAVIRYMLGRPLDFDPGAKYAYSNLGYNILGRIIEQRTGRSYAAAVRELVLVPSGITRMQLGRTLPKFRAAGEVCYYHHDDRDRAESIFAYAPGKVAWPDGGFHLEAMDAHGGWIASAVDLLRFATAVDGQRGAALLRPATVRQMLAEPPGLPGKDGSHYGCGWSVRRQEGGANWFHTGSLPGTTTLLVRAHNGLAWAVLFNSRPENTRRFQREIDAGLWTAAGQVTDWPRHDLFEKFR